MRSLALLCLALVLWGCASSPHDLRMKEGRDFLEQGDVFRAFNAVKGSLRGEEEESAKALALLNSVEGIQSHLADEYQSRLLSLPSFSETATHFSDVGLAAHVGVMAEERARDIRTQLEDMALQRTLDGGFTPNFEDPWGVFPAVSESAEAMNVILRNSLSYLTIYGPTDGQRRPMLANMIRYVWRGEGNPHEKRLVREALANIQFSIAELRADVRQIDSSFASARLDAQILDFFIDGEGGSRIIARDVGGLIARADRFTNVYGPGDAEARVFLRELDYRPRSEIMPTRSVVVELPRERRKKKDRVKMEYDEDTGEYYAVEEVEKPQDARFFFEVEAGSDRLDWAYEVYIESDLGRGGPPTLLRGSYEETYHRCYNGRVMDTMGGSTIHIRGIGSTMRTGAIAIKAGREWGLRCCGKG